MHISELALPAGNNNNDKTLAFETHCKPAAWDAGKARPLDTTDFAAVVAAAPLIAIDLIVGDSAGRALFGMRKNPPAKNFWFVPGGRIFKNESLDRAFNRIARVELGLDIDRRDSRLIGIYEHFYDTNFLGERGADTHYIVLAHAIEAAPNAIDFPRQQHSEYVWIQETDVVRHPHIHPYAKAYFPNE